MNKYNQSNAAALSKVSVLDIEPAASSKIRKDDLVISRITGLTENVLETELSLLGDHVFKQKTYFNRLSQISVLQFMVSKNSQTTRSLQTTLLF